MPTIELQGRVRCVAVSSIDVFGAHCSKLYSDTSLCNLSAEQTKLCTPGAQGSITVYGYMLEWPGALPQRLDVVQGGLAIRIVKNEPSSSPFRGCPRVFNDWKRHGLPTKQFSWT